MKRLLTLALGTLLSVSLLAVADAASSDPAARRKTPQGISNAKKVAQARVERYQKIREVRKKGQAQRHLAQNRKLRAD